MTALWITLGIIGYMAIAIAVASALRVGETFVTEGTEGLDIYLGIFWPCAVPIALLFAVGIAMDRIIDAITRRAKRREAS